MRDGRVLSSVAVVLAGAIVSACGTSTHPTTSTHAPAASTQAVHTTAATPAANSPDGRCAAAVPQSLAPPQGNFPGPSDYQQDHRAAQASANAILPASRSAPKLSRVVAELRSAAAIYAHNASLPIGTGSPYLLARSYEGLNLAASDAASAGLPACAKAIHRLNATVNGSVGKPANPASCPSSAVPVGGGCVPKHT